MPNVSPKVRIARCSCGDVEIETLGDPILSAVCHCDDCQEGSRQIEQLENAPSVLDECCGTAYHLYRKDRIKCCRGSDLLRDYCLKDKSPTRRVVADCCNSFMFLDFQKGHWFSMVHGRYRDGGPPLQMRIQTKCKPADKSIPSDMPAYSAFPIMFIGKLVFAKLGMIFRR